MPFSIPKYHNFKYICSKDKVLLPDFRNPIYKLIYLIFWNYENFFLFFTSTLDKKSVQKFEHKV